MQAYEIRLHERELCLDSTPDKHAWDLFEHLKFEPNGDIKPFYGLTCISWVDITSPLFRRLSEFQDVLHSDLKQAGLAKGFAFLKPASFHMTICDLTAGSGSQVLQPSRKVCDQIQTTLEASPTTEPVSAQVKGIGLNTTITALVRFNEVAQLEQVLHFERQIKQATGYDVRQFTGHITLAYCVGSTVPIIEPLLETLKPYAGINLGEFVFNQFDLTYFTDMNTFKSLLTVDFTRSQVERYHNSDIKAI
jgi:hypothetical protein